MERKNIEPREFVNELRKKRLNSKTKVLVQKNGHKYLLHVSDVLEDYETNLNMVFSGYNTPEKIRKYKIPGDTVENMKISFKKKLSGIAKKIEDQTPKDNLPHENENHDSVPETEKETDSKKNIEEKTEVQPLSKEEEVVMDFASDDKDFTLSDDDLNIDTDSKKEETVEEEDNTEKSTEKKQSLKDILNESLAESSPSLTPQTNNGIILSDNNISEDKKVKTTTIDQAEVETDIKQEEHSSEETDASMSDILTSRNEALEELVEQFKTRLVQATQVINDLNNTIAEKNQKISNLETGADEEQKRAVSEALVLAQEMKNSIIETANKKSEQIIQEAQDAAHDQATEIISHAKLQADEESKRAKHAQKEYSETLTGVSELIARLKSVETGEFAIDDVEEEDIKSENDLGTDTETDSDSDNTYSAIDDLLPDNDKSNVDDKLKGTDNDNDSQKSFFEEETGSAETTQTQTLVDDSISQFDMAIANIHKE